MEMQGKKEYILNITKLEKDAVKKRKMKLLALRIRRVEARR